MAVWRWLRDAVVGYRGTTAPTVSLCQRDCLDLRAERWIRWQAEPQCRENAEVIHHAEASSDGL